MGKMIDLGKKYPQPEKASSLATESKDHVSYPSIYIDGKKGLPGKVGGTIHAKVKLRKVSHTVRHEKDGTTHSQSFDVMGIDPGEGSPDDTDMDEAMDESNHQDGGRLNSQSQIEAGLESAENANEAKIKNGKGKKG